MAQPPSPTSPRRKTPIHKWTALWALLAWFVWPVSASNADDFAVEGQLRAAVAVGVLRWTSWLDSAAENNPNLKICLVGEPVSEPYLLPIGGTRKIGKKNIIVESLENETWQSCQAFVLGDDVKFETMSRLFKFAESNSALTMCDGCSKHGVKHSMIILRLEKQRVRFEVNLLKTQEAKIHLDASLLELASQVRRK